MESIYYEQAHHITVDYEQISKNMYPYSDGCFMLLPFITKLEDNPNIELCNDWVMTVCETNV